jgi:hypothetical protein
MNGSDIHTKLATVVAELRVFAEKVITLGRDCLLIELALPMSPLLIQFLLKRFWPVLGEATFYKPTLAVAGMMLPLVLYIRTTGSVRNLFMLLMVCGTILYTMSVMIESPIWPTTSTEADLRLCYQLSAGGVFLSGSCRLITESCRIFI